MLIKLCCKIMHVNHTRKSDYLGRYFTSERVGQLLIDSMQNVSPSLVLDLGAGDGALTAAASKQWSDALFLTVDIDLNARSKSLESVTQGRFTHTTTDALSHDLPNKINLSLASADAAICNPPYIRPKWHSDFKYILEEAGLDDVLYSKRDISAELLFIAQNLRLLKSGGLLGLILPDGIISGDKHLDLRRKLLECHSVESVIELPRRVFRRTDAKTHILVLRKNGLPSKNITLQRVDENNNFCRPMQVSTSSAVERLDYTYHSRDFNKSNGIKVSDILIKLVRGNISSSERQSRNYPVFHTSDMCSGQYKIPFNFFINNEKLVNNEVVACHGDILISRVGRNLTDKICMVENGNVVISDCIILIRVSIEHRNKLFLYLISSEGKDYLNALSHGVGAKFLTQKAILNLTF